MLKQMARVENQQHMDILETDDRMGNLTDRGRAANGKNLGLFYKSTHHLEFDVYFIKK
jgi:hypothetical protein